MSKSKATTASSKTAKTVATKNLEFSPDYNELKEMSLNESECKGENLDLLTVMSNPKYFDFINDILNTSLKAAGINPNDCSRNFAKLFCLYSLAYPIRYYCFQEIIQKKLTIDILKMKEPEEDLNKMLLQFGTFRDLIDPEETGMLNVSDKRLKDFLIPKH